MWFGDGLADPVESFFGSFSFIFHVFFLMSFRDDLLTMSTATDLAIAFFLGRPREAFDLWNSAHRVLWVAYYLLA